MILWTVAALAAEPAAETIELGIGGGLGLELPDPYGAFGPLARCEILSEGGGSRQTMCLPILHLKVPIRLALAPQVSLRLTLAPVFGVGTHEWSWEDATGERRSFPFRTFFASVPLTAGPEVRIPVKGQWQPFFAGGLGLALSGTFHSTVGAPELFDPEVYPYDDTASWPTLSPYAIQPSLASDVVFGISNGTLWFELDYALQFVGRDGLKGTNPDLSVLREPVQWNTLLLSIGISP